MTHRCLTGENAAALCWLVLRWLGDDTEANSKQLTHLQPVCRTILNDVLIKGRK